MKEEEFVASGGTYCDSDAIKKAKENTKHMEDGVCNLDERDKDALEIMKL